jgi:hypothetical protein
VFSAVLPGSWPTRQNHACTKAGPLYKSPANSEALWVPYQVGAVSDELRC